MKRSLRKIILTSVIMAFFALCLAIFVSAETYTVTYYHNDTAKHKEPHSSEETVVLSTSKFSNSSYTFYGWLSDDGVLYEPGEEIKLTRDLKLYEASGEIINSEADLLSKFKDNGFVYYKLGKDMTLTQQLSATHGSNWTVHFLDLNGHNLTISGCQYATGAIRNGVVLVGEGTINFTSNNLNDGAFYETSKHGYGDWAQRLWIGKKVTVVSNVPLIRVTNDMSGYVGLPKVELWGNITCPYLVRAQGLADVDINIYDTAKINITGTQYPLLRDTSSYDDMVIMSLNVYGGTFTFPDGFKGFVTSDDTLKNCFPVTIKGGTFNMDIAKYISVDYKTVDNDDGTYSVEPNICADSPTQRHKYIATNITVNCTEDGVIDYKCEYCGLTYTAQRFALGHNTITLKISDLVNTKKKTTPGMYSNTCTRCGSIEYTYFFPDPSTVYVTVKVKYERDGQKYTDTLRVKSSELFGFTHDDDSSLAVNTYLTTFGVTRLNYTFDDGREESFKMSEIVGIEIPLGTTKIYGGYQHGTYTGVFYKNSHLQEINLPLSLETVQKGAFADMPALTTVNGVEYISDTIDEYAFGQSKENAHLIFDTLEINAKTVNSSAFKNALATRIIIGESVRSLGDAFKLDSDIAKIEAAYDNNTGMLKEIFVKKLSENYPLSENPNLYGKNLSDVYNSFPAEERTRIFGSITTGSALLTKAPVYYDHSYTITKYEPTCLAEGYTAYECKYCKIGDKTDFVSNAGITHVWERSKKDDVQPTCSKEGYTAERCSICNSIQKLDTLEKNNKHDFTTTDPEPDYDACTKTTYHLRRRCANEGCGAWSTTAQRKIVVTEAEILGHDFASDEGIVQIPATCGTPGQTIKTCSRCYEQQVTESAATGIHLWIRDNTQRVAPTCVSAGSNFFKCQNCPTTSTEPIPVLSYEDAVTNEAHVWADEVISEPTRTSAGIKRVYCSLCNVDRKVNTYVAIPAVTDSGLPVWAIILIVVGGLLLLGGIALVVVLTVTKKKNASKNYKYKFNTFRK